MTPLLNTERMRLRPVMRSDQQHIFEGLSHPEVIQYYGVSYPSFEATSQQMDWYQNHEEQHTGYFWVLEHALTGSFMGVVGVYFIQPQHRCGELGYWLLPQFWRQGYSFEAISAIVPFIQTTVKLHRISAEIEVENTASLKLMQRLGFEQEGVKKDCEFKAGRYISLSLWAKIFPEN